MKGNAALSVVKAQNVFIPFWSDTSIYNIYILKVVFRILSICVGHLNCEVGILIEKRKKKTQEKSASGFQRP